MSPRMSFVRLVLVLFTLLLAGLSSAAEPNSVLSARYPALSPDGRTIAFTYMGDLWTVPSSGGEARRLTVHEAEDILPQYSPDGAWILFSSRRYNNYDLFIIPAEGGAPRQITSHTADEFASGWFPKGDSVIFNSPAEGLRDLYKVAVTGGTPVKLTGYPNEQEFNGRITSDGRHMIYNNGSGYTRWWRRDLKAGRNVDIFLQDRTKTPFTSVRLTSDERYDLWPILNESRNEIYFVSCRGDWGQVYKMPSTGGEPTAMTDFTGDGVTWLNANPQGTMLVFEQGAGLWLLDPADGTPRRVPITVRTDEPKNLIAEKTFDGNVEWYSLSPDGKKIAAVIWGEIYVIPAEKPKEGKQITFTTAREKHPVWGADSKTIYYSSDRSGNYDIYCADVTTGTETRLSGSPENELKPVVSPDGKHLAFYRGLDKIIRYDIAEGKETVWVTGNFLDLGIEANVDYDWSPDSKWLTFAMAGPTYETNIFAVSLDGALYDLSRTSGYNGRPRFSADGKLVYYTSGVEDNPTTYKIDLIPKPAEFFEATFDSLFADTGAAAASKEKKPAKDTAAAKAPSVVVTIDTSLIDQRRVKAFELPGTSESPVLTPDGKKFVFLAAVTGKPDIWSITTGDDPELKQVTKNGKEKSNLIVTSDSKEVLYLEGGKIIRTAIADGASTPLGFKAKMTIDTRALYKQKFNEAWQMLNTYFYDPSFHGTDWAAVRDKYQPALDHIRTDAEFRNVVLEMLGELRASHLELYSQEPGPSSDITVGETGLLFDYAALDMQKRFRIARVLPESPAALAGISAGGYIQAIDGMPLSGDTDIYKLLAGTIGHRVKMTIADKPDGKGKEYDLKPVNRAAIMDLVYNDWVNSRRRMVDSLSGGTLAYLHIRSMGAEQLETFREQLVALGEPKEGLVIDVRDNPGGYIAVHLLEILFKEPYLIRTFRDFPPTTETKMRSKSAEKPMILLTNNYSGSNAEIFAEGFRRLKLGKIVGEPTGSSVIGTGEYTLIDGQRIRRPSWGAYTMDKEDTDLLPRRPDIFVENLPDDFINGRDPQLVRAVSELLQEIK